MNPSGITPAKHMVLVAPIPVEEKTAGGIILTPKAVEREQFAGTRGRVIAVAPFAFNYVTDGEWTAAGAQKPQAGNMVLYQKHAGTKVTGKDGKDYVLLTDETILATIED